MPTPAPQPLAPAQFEPQSGAISIANIAAMAIPLARTRAILCVSFSISDPKSQRYAKQQHTSTQCAPQ